MKKENKQKINKWNNAQIHPATTINTTTTTTHIFPFWFVFGWKLSKSPAINVLSANWWICGSSISPETIIRSTPATIHNKSHSHASECGLNSVSLLNFSYCFKYNVRIPLASWLPPKNRTSNSFSDMHHSLTFQNHTRSFSYIEYDELNTDTITELYTYMKRQHETNKQTNIHKRQIQHLFFSKWFLLNIIRTKEEKKLKQKEKKG